MRKKLALMSSPFEKGGTKGDLKTKIPHNLPLLKGEEHRYLALEVIDV
jgi:hypothetical protein